MSKPLPKRLRTKWDALIETEGKKLGLENCRPFLENKMVNDIFYEGTFKGRPCIVKCSSKDPESIVNEYEILRKLSIIDSDHCHFPEVFACFTTEDHKLAFLAMEKITVDPSIAPETAVEDLLAIAAVLKKSGVVHRDIFRDNVLLSTNGHLKLFDFQFAVNRERPHISKWLRHHWKYHFIIFARLSNQSPASWNDAYALRRLVIKDFASATNADKAIEILEKTESAAEFTLSFPTTKIPALIFYTVNLWIQTIFFHKETKRRIVNKRFKITRDLLRHTISHIIIGKR